MFACAGAENVRHFIRGEVPRTEWRGLTPSKYVAIVAAVWAGAVFRNDAHLPEACAYPLNERDLAYSAGFTGKIRPRFKRHVRNFAQRAAGITSELWRPRLP